MQRAGDRPNGVLEAADASFDDAVDVTTFHADLEKKFKSVMAVRDTGIDTPTGPPWA